LPEQWRLQLNDHSISDIMMLTEEQKMIRSAARDYAQRRLAPNAAEWERRGAFPRAVIREMGELGLMGVTVPPAWDGTGADYVAYALALEEIAAGDGAVATVMSGHNSVGCMPLLEYGSDGQKEQYLRRMARGEALCAFCLTEPQGGSDLSTLRTRARRTAQGYVIQGSKQFITSGKTADLAVVIAVTDPAAGTRGFSAFLVETGTPGYRVGRIEKKMGLNASDTCEVFFEDMVVPHDALLGQEGQGYRIALSNLEGGRIGIAATAVAWRAARSSWRWPTRRSGAPSARRSWSTRACRSGWPTWRRGSRRRASSCCTPPPCAAPASRA